MPAASPQRRSRGNQLESRERISLFRDREEALKAHAHRRLIEEQTKLTEAQRGHLRFGLIERILVFASWLASLLLAVIGILSLLNAALVIGGSVSTLIGLAVVKGRVTETGL